MATFWIGGILFGQKKALTDLPVRAFSDQPNGIRLNQLLGNAKTVKVPPSLVKEFKLL